MSEDKMREEFYKAFPKFAGILEMDEAGSISHLDSMTARHQFAVWEACAAIKDAEIAHWQQVVVEENRNSQKEIAARDLMIKEFIARLSTIQSLYKRMITEWEADNYLHQDTCDELDKALANSEHHNSRALEKMLLEARIDELESFGREIKFGHRQALERVAQLRRKLVALNT